MAGLLEHEGYRARGLRRRRRRRRRQHVQRARARGRQALLAPRRDSGGDGRRARSRPSSPSPVASRSRKGRRSSAAARPSTSSSARRASSSCPRSSIARSNRAARSSTSTRTTTSRFRWAWCGTRIPCARASRSSKAATSSARSASCPYTRGHERMRPVADILAEVPPGRRQRAPRGPAPRADRQSLSGARRRHVRFRGAAGARVRDPRARADSLREPASAPRDRADSSPRFATCRRSASICIFRCSPARIACFERCGAGTRATSTSTWSTARERPCPISRCRRT